MDKNKSTSRRTLLRMTLGAGLLWVGGVGQASADHGGDGIRINNGTYDVIVGEKSSDTWVFNGSEDVFEEQPALSEGGEQTVWASDGNLIQSYPDHGTPGTEYTAVLELPISGTTVELERRARLDSTAPLLQLTYQLTNVGDTGLSDLRLFQYVDYDIDDDTSDNGDYVPDPEYIYQYDSSSGQGVGFTGSERADRYDITEPYFAPENAINDGQLLNRDWDESGIDDLGAALQWNFGSLGAGETSSALSVGFAAGTSQSDIGSLLAEFSNTEPTASFSVSPEPVAPHQEATFDASGATDSDGLIVSYAWDFNGDGTTDEVTSSAQTTNTYVTAGEYEVTLLVTDDDGATSGPVTRTVSVESDAVNGMLQRFGPPQDCDGDGLFEDVNGDGQVDIQDVQALHQIKNRHVAGSGLSSAQQAMFDFNGDGTFDHQDVTALEQQIRSGTACNSESGDGGTQDGDSGLPDWVVG